MNTMVKDPGDITMDFSALSMYEVHAIQKATVTKMRKRECTLVNKVKYSHKSVNKIKKIV